jgi:hypothetical protein
MLKIIASLITVLYIVPVFAHFQHIHQYMVIEAYQLLKLQYGELEAFENYIGGTDPFFAGDFAWQRGYVTTGAWREDEEDVIFNYDKIFIPVPGINFALVSITHFWDADNGDLTKNYFVIRKESFPDTTIGSWENSYDKFSRYAHGSWILWFPDIIECTNPDNGHKLIITPLVTSPFERFGIPVSYTELTEFYKSSELNLHSEADGKFEILDISVLPPRVISPESVSKIQITTEAKDRIVWEVMGRMAHLLADLSVPAHTHLDEHGLLADMYENWIGGPTKPYRIWSSANCGQFINPYINDDNPLHFLMYTMHQQTDHFGSNGPGDIGNGDDLFGGDPWPAEINYLSNLGLDSFGEPATSNGPWDSLSLENIRDKTFPFAIKATAGLFYWFAVETGMIVADIITEETYGTLDYQLAQNYPNPFNPTTNFEFRISDCGLATLKIYDILGNEVATIVNEELPAGNYKYQWNAGRLASGVYFCILQAGNFVDTKKLILMK